MKKVLFCASRASHIVYFHRSYLEYYKQMGWEIHIVTEGIVDLPEVDRSIDLSFSKRHFSGSNLKTILKLAALIRKEKYQLISSHATLAGLICRGAIMLSGYREATVVHTSHGYLFEDNQSLKSKLYLACEKLTSGRVDELMVMNQEDYKIANRYHLGRQIHFIDGMGIEQTHFPTYSEEEKSKVRDSLKIAKEDFVFLCVGEFSKRKNQTIILDALAQIDPTQRPVKLLFAGDGNQLEACKQQAKKLGIEKNVLFLGRVDQINSLYQIADAAISASFSEGLPFNIMEALLCHLPIIASEVKGHVDLLENGVNGLLFSVQQPQQLVSAMNLLLNDSHLYNQIKQHAYLPERYLIDQVKPVVLNYYQQLIT